MNQYKFSVVLNAASSGPLTTIFLFYFVGNTWTYPELRTVFTCGILLLLPSLWIIYFFDDKFALKHQEVSEKVSNGDKENSRNDSEDEDRDEVMRQLVEPLLEQEDDDNVGETTLSKEDDASEQISSSARYWVPRIIVGSDLIAGFASGMTIKFFPLFFKEESLMTPSQVSWVTFIVFFMISFFSYLARICATRIGIVNTILMFQIPGKFVQISHNCSRFRVSGCLLLTSMYAMSIGHDIKVPGMRLPQSRFLLYMCFRASSTVEK